MGSGVCQRGHIASRRSNESVGTIALTLTQWLPKPATSQFPEKGRSLRETWSRSREREQLSPVRVDFQFLVMESTPDRRKMGERERRAVGGVRRTNTV